MLFNPPLVSVIIPVYNRADILERCLMSVFKQTYQNWEVIIVDDGSKDDIETIIKDLTFGINQPITYIRQENQGPGIARKNGLAIARGKYVQYLDSDDEILPQKLSKQVVLLESDPEAVMCYCPTITKGINGTEGYRKFSDQYEPDLLKGALEWRRWHTSSCLWHYPDKSIAYWSKYYNGEDVLHDVSVGVHTRKVIFDPEVMVIAHQGFEQVSNAPRTKSRLFQVKQALYGVRTESFHFLKNHNLFNQKIYTDPLSERFFHGGLQLLKLHALGRGLKSLVYSILTSRYTLRTFFAIGGIVLALLTVTIVPSLFAKYFKLYRKITPASVNFRRTV